MRDVGMSDGTCMWASIRNRVVMVDDCAQWMQLMDMRNRRGYREGYEGGVHTCAGSRCASPSDPELYARRMHDWFEKYGVYMT